MPEPSLHDRENAPSAPAPPNVLVIDDEEMMRAMLARELPRLGFTVTTAAGGEEGIERAQNEEFSVAVVDILMPGLDGLETLKRLRHESPGTEVVLLTGHGTIEGAVAGMRAGAYDYLTKPCRLAEPSAGVWRGGGAPPPPSPRRGAAGGGGGGRGGARYAGRPPPLRTRPA